MVLEKLLFLLNGFWFILANGGIWTFEIIDELFDWDGGFKLLKRFGNFLVILPGLDILFKFDLKELSLLVAFKVLGLIFLNLCLLTDPFHVEFSGSKNNLKDFGCIWNIGFRKLFVDLNETGVWLWNDDWFGILFFETDFLNDFLVLFKLLSLFKDFWLKFANGWYWMFGSIDELLKVIRWSGNITESWTGICWDGVIMIGDILILVELFGVIICGAAKMVGWYSFWNAGCGYEDDFAIILLLFLKLIVESEFLLEKTLGRLTLFLWEDPPILFIIKIGSTWIGTFLRFVKRVVWIYIGFGNAIYIDNINTPCKITNTQNVNKNAHLELSSVVYMAIDTNDQTRPKFKHPRKSKIKNFRGKFFVVFNVYFSNWKNWAFFIQKNLFMIIIAIKARPITTVKPIGTTTVIISGTPLNQQL